MRHSGVCPGGPAPDGELPSCRPWPRPQLAGVLGLALAGWAVRTADLFFAGAWLVGAGWFEPAHKQRMGAHALSRGNDWVATPGEAAREWGPCTGLVRWRAILLC